MTKAPAAPARDAAEAPAPTAMTKGPAAPARDAAEAPPSSTDAPAQPGRLAVEAPFADGALAIYQLQPAICGELLVKLGAPERLPPSSSAPPTCGNQRQPSEMPPCS